MFKLNIYKKADDEKSQSLFIHLLYFHTEDHTYSGTYSLWFFLPTEPDHVLAWFMPPDLLSLPGFHLSRFSPDRRTVCSLHQKYEQ